METQESKSIVSTPGAVIIAGAVIAVAIILVNLFPAQPGAATPSPQPAARAADGSKVKTAGEPFIGNPSAPIAVAYWYDYQCPFCQRHEEETMPQIIKDYVETGKVKIVFKDYQFLGPDSQTAGLASRAVWEVAPERFYDWHKAMYDKQDDENGGWGTKDDILALTRTVLDEDAAARVGELMTSRADEYQKEMDEDKAEGAAMGITGTPGTIVGTQLIQGAQPYAAFQVAIEAALAGK